MTMTEKTTTQKNAELVAALARMTTPFDGIDKKDSEAMDAAEDGIDGDQERDDASTLWQMIEAAREIVADEERAADERPFLVLGTYADGQRWADSFTVQNHQAAESMVPAGITVAGVVEIIDGELVVVA